MDYVLLMAGLNLMLCGWVLLLQRRLKTYQGALEGAIMMVDDLATGKAVIEKTANGIRVRRIKDDGQV